MSVTRAFLADSRRFLMEDYLPNIERCVSLLTPEQVWSRPNEGSNSIGNLLLHLAGSSRWWAAEIIGGEPTGRVRQQEFDERSPLAPPELLKGLRAAVEEVDRRLASLNDTDLLRVCANHDESPTVLWCVYHIVEHFSYHTGQIAMITKAFVGTLPER